MKRIVIAIAALPVLAAVPAMAQGPNAATRDQCWQAVANKAQARFAARNVDQLSSQVSAASPAENLMRGRGMADGTPFAYSCTYSLRTGRTYAVSVRPEQRRMPLPGGSWAETCTSPEMRGTVLFAQCRMAGGGWNPTRLDMRSCSTGRVSNLDGALVCR
jgi:hypothetical protein